MDYLVAVHKWQVWNRRKRLLVLLAKQGKALYTMKFSLGKKKSGRKMTQGKETQIF